MLVFDITTQYPAAISISGLRYDFLRQKQKDAKTHYSSFYFRLQIIR